MIMLPFAPFMFPDSATFAPAGYNTGIHAGVNPKYTPGAPIPCWVEINLTASRRTEDHNIPEGVKIWSVFTPSNPGATVDSQILVTQAGGSQVRTFTATQKSTNAGYSVLWKTDCQEVT